MNNFKNVIFIISDQHRGDFVPWESNGVTLMPNLNKLASAGMVFNNAYCNAPLCSPSRATIASGRYGMNNGCFTNLHELPHGSQSFVSQLRKAGYSTAVVGKAHMEIHAYDSNLTSEKHHEYMHSLGWDFACEVSGSAMLKTGIECYYSKFLKDNAVFDDVLEYYRRWQYFMDKRPGFQDFHMEPWPLNEKYQETTFICDQAVTWLENRDSSKPFLLQVGFAAPHSPIEANQKYMKLYDKQIESEPFSSKLNSETENARKGYRAMITQIDYNIGRLLNTLDTIGELENTLIIYSADHGEMAGDHGRIGKTCFYEGSMRVPLVVAGAGIKAKESNALVELIDIGTTICDYCGVETHTLDQGKSILPLMSDDADIHRENVYAEMGCDRMLFDGRYKLMYGDPSSDQRQLGSLHLDKPVNIDNSPIKLYDLLNDPMELNDISKNNKYYKVLNQMEELLLKRINKNIQTEKYKSRGTYKSL
jgi:arylsulfatase A-like enzyme